MPAGRFRCPSHFDVSVWSEEYLLGAIPLSMAVSDEGLRVFFCVVVRIAAGRDDFELFFSDGDAFLMEPPLVRAYLRRRALRS